MSRKAEAILLASFFVAHIVETLFLHTPYDTLWACHVSCLWLAAGALYSSGVCTAIGLSWLVVGTPLWLFDLLAGSALVKTSLLTHVGGLALAIRRARRDGFPRGTWWKATLALLGLVMLTRVVTPAHANVNLAFSVFPGFEKWFPTYPRYFVFLFFTNALVFWATERIAQRLPAMRMDRENVREAA